MALSEAVKTSLNNFKEQKMIFIHISMMLIQSAYLRDKGILSYVPYSSSASVVYTVIMYHMLFYK